MAVKEMKPNHFGTNIHPLNGTQCMRYLQSFWIFPPGLSGMPRTSKLLYKGINPYIKTYQDVAIKKLDEIGDMNSYSYTPFLLLYTAYLDIYSYSLLLLLCTPYSYTPTPYSYSLVLLHSYSYKLPTYIDRYIFIYNYLSINTSTPYSYSIPIPIYSLLIYIYIYISIYSYSLLLLLYTPILPTISPI